MTNHDIQIENSGQGKKVIAGSINVLCGNIISNALNALRTLVIARIIGPSLYGIWNILMVIFSYNSYASLGLVDGMSKEMPYLIGKGDFIQAEEVKNNTFWAVFSITTLVNILLVIVSFIFESIFPRTLIVGLRILSIANILFHFYSFFLSLLRTGKIFSLYSLVTVMFSMTSLFFVLLFFRLFPNNKLYGAILALLVAYLLANAFVFFRVKYRFKFALDFPRIRKIFNIGLPLIIIQIGYILFISVDRWMIAGMIDQVNLGYYGIGFSIGNFLFAGVSTVAFTLYPFMLEKYGKTDNPQLFEQLVYPLTMVVSYFAAIICTLTALLTPLLILYVLPEYAPGINAAVVMILGTYFISIMTISGNFLVSVNKQKLILYLQIIAIPLSILLNYIFIRRGYGITGVALAMAMAYFFYGTGIILTAFQNFGRNYRALFLRLVKIYFPFFACLLIYLFLNSFSITTRTSFSRDLTITSIQVFIFGSFTILLLLYLNKITGAINILRDFISVRLKQLFKRQNHEEI